MTPPFADDLFIDGMPAGLQQPSLRDLVEMGASNELVHRLGGQKIDGWTKVEVDPTFWTREWPHLLRAAARQEDRSCLRELLCLVGNETGGDCLPVRFLGDLLLGLGEQGRHYMSLDADIRKRVFERVSRSSVSFNLVHGLAIMGRGGLWSAFYQHENGTDTHDVRSLAQVERAWTRWCAKPEHQSAGIVRVCDLIETMGIRNEGRESFLSLMKNIPHLQQDGLVARMAQGLDAVLERKGMDTCHMRVMSRWATLFEKKQWPMDHEVWRKWASRYCQVLEHTEASGNEAVAMTQDWVDAFLDATQPGTPPERRAGWTWNSAQARGYFMGRGQEMVAAFATHESGDALHGQKLAQLGTWLRQAQELWDRLVALGFVGEHDRGTFNAAMDEGMGTDWVSRMDRMMADPDIVAQDSGQRLAQAWTGWKARTLAWHAHQIKKDEPDRVERGRILRM